MELQRQRAIYESLFPRITTPDSFIPSGQPEEGNLFENNYVENDYVSIDYFE